MPNLFALIEPILAGGDVRSPSVFACVVLLAMIAYFRWRASRGDRTLDRRYICVTVLVAGPMFGLLYFVFDAYLLSKHEFIHPDDYWGDLMALTMLGSAAGLAASAVLWVGLS